MSGPVPPRGAGRILRAIVRCARGRPDGLALFDATTRGFASSLAPLVAFPLVGTAVGLGREGALAAAVNLAATMCGVLAPPVVSHAVARAFGREEGWLRFAVAYDWCQWVLPVLVFGAALAALFAAPLLDALHVGTHALVGGLAMALIGYWLWLHWFLARHALDLSKARAALLVLAVNGCTGAILLLPQWVG